jgi:dihydroxy-acid dehydratase
MALTGGPVPAEVVTPAAIRNAQRVLLAVSGSTNAVVHMAAVAGRIGMTLDLDDFNRLSDETPVLVDLKPVGAGYMEDFHFAGGLEGVLREIAPQLETGTRSITGETLAERLARPLADPIDRAVIREAAQPIFPVGGLIALRGSLAPEGAILKRAAATEALLEHEGRAVVFEGLEDLSKRVDDPDLDVTPNDVLVLKHAGPHAAGMPEAGYLPIPKKLAQAGVKDMVRISDARMSGTAFGTIVLHVSPEAAVGGPLSLVRDGDRIRLSARDKRIDLLVGPAELARRAAGPGPAPYRPARGYARLYNTHVTSATEGCDFDFLGPEKG